MRALLQRVTRAAVDVDGERVGEIGSGLLVFLAVQGGDTPADAERLVERVIGYRVFPDSEGRMNLSLQDTKGQMLVVSQFTLAADTRKGRRPSFSGSAKPELAERLYRHFVDEARGQLPSAVETGRFAADMQVSLVNDGPVTFLLETP